MEKIEKMRAFLKDNKLPLYKIAVMSDIHPSAFSRRIHGRLNESPNNEKIVFDAVSKYLKKILADLEEVLNDK